MRARIEAAAVACVLAAGLLAWQAPAAADEVPVDLELVLAVDVSGSMDVEEQRIQRAGYVAALTDPEVLRAIASGSYGRVAIAYVEWAGSMAQELTVPWELVDDGESAEAFAQRLAAAPTARIRGTSISGALAFSAPLFDSNGYEGLRRVIDISGDGPNNMGPPVVPARDAVLERGIVINGLPVMLRPSQLGTMDIAALDVYYTDCVIGGPGSFVLPVREPGQFAEAIRQKLVLEIAGLPPRVTLAAERERERASRSDCMVGERLRRSWEWSDR
jgi:hypothetical protein